tara:strand:- start:7155 stop:7442 length:288 start_codon:yes stop_codon:yes gene_type:complete
MNRLDNHLYCPTCGHNTDKVYQCAEHDGWKELFLSNQKLLESRELVDIYMNKLQKLIEFYGNQENYKPNESDDMLVIHDRGQLARKIKKEIIDGV